MPASRPFLFDRSFIGNGLSVTVGRGSAASESPPAKQFDESDIAAARADGVAQGQAQARAEAEADDRRRLTVACEAIAARLADLFRETEVIGAAAAKEATELAVAIARKLLPETCRRQGLTEIEGMLTDVMRHLSHQPRLTVAVHPSLAAAARERTAALAAERGYAGRVEIISDPSVAEDACTAEWAEGGAIRSPRAVWGEIDSILARTTGYGVEHAKEGDPSTSAQGTLLLGTSNKGR